MLNKWSQASINGVGVVLMWDEWFCGKLLKDGYMASQNDIITLHKDGG